MKTKIKKEIEIKNYQIQTGSKGVDSTINVMVKIDYSAETVTLIEKIYNHETAIYNYVTKPWTFEGRSKHYHQGWNNILDAMKSAMQLAFEELEEYLAIERNNRVNALEGLLNSELQIAAMSTPYIQPPKGRGRPKKNK